MSLSTTSLILNSIAILLYLGGTAYLIACLRQKQASSPTKVRLLVCAALVFQAIGSYHMLILPEGLNFGFFKVGSFIFWIMNSIVLLSSLKKPLHSLFIFLFPLSALALLTAIGSGATTEITQVSKSIIAHILLSVFAYSLLIIATLQALLLAYQDHQLKHKHPTGLVRLLPPLQTMEALFFEILAAGELLLTLAIITGFLFLENMFSQHLVHKTILSIIAWVIYAILLFGHWRQGWRGYAAIRWALGGFSVLMLAYFGSKFVLEILLSNT